MKTDSLITSKKLSVLEQAAQNDLKYPKNPVYPVLYPKRRSGTDR
jgi:hypothetical protein